MIYRFFKRLFDILIAGLGLVLLSPALVGLAWWIRRDSAGPALYWDERVGQNGRRFKMAKFRTMVVTAETGPAITLGQDTRVTCAGKWLRHYRLDELPQLWNVLKGEMSLVGPRPEKPLYVDLYTPEQKQVLTVKPGITGLTQLEYKDEARLLTGPDWETRYRRQVMPAKLAIDLHYVAQAGLWQDAKIMLKTAYRVLYPYTQENQPVLRGRHLFLIDVLLVMLAYILSFALRFDNLAFWTEFLKHTLILFPFLLVKLVVFYQFGLYRQVWRYAGIRELMTIAGAVTVSTLIIGSITLLLWVMPPEKSPVAGFPRSVLGIDWLMTLLLVGGFRFTLRAIGEFSPAAEPALLPAGGVKRSLIIGTEKGAARVARELQQLPSPGFIPVGLIIDTPAQTGLSIHNLPVLGSLPNLPRIITEHRINELIIAAPDAGGDFTRQVLRHTQGQTVAIKTLPSYHKLIEGSGGLAQIRNIQIEDLLRRDPIETDVTRIARYITGQKILITGAGGSIGGELCRQLSGFGPAEIILLGHGENSIFQIQQELKTAFPRTRFIPVISDIRDLGRMTRLLAKHQPHVIFHAAAHKHVPMMELNPEEAIINNVLGTKVLLEAAEAMEIPRLVLISSDKAVAPQSIMGATKRIAELMVQSVARRSGYAYAAVRFGNVLGSRGSIVPTFQKQIAAGGPVTVTHPDVSRYFMTIPEAVQLVIQAAALGAGGEIFVLDMGRPVKIVDLAADLIRLSGLEPGADIAITFTGLRPGEKLHEALFNPHEQTSPTTHPKITVVASPPPDETRLWAQISTLINVAYSYNADQLKTVIQEIVPEAYLPEETL